MSEDHDKGDEGVGEPVTAYAVEDAQTGSDFASPEIEQAWIEEARRRSEALKHSDTKGMTLSEAKAHFARIRDRIL